MIRHRLRLLCLLPATLLSLPAVAAPVASIRDVDFRNFTYPPPYEDAPEIRAADGRYESRSEDDTVFFEVLDVAYGDITGDGTEEAVVRTLTNTGGTGQFTDGLIYEMEAGVPVLKGTLGVGDRADGGIHRIRIEEGTIVVARYGQERSGACCPEYVETSRLRLRGREIVDVAPPTRCIYTSFLNEGTTGIPLPVHFLPGTTGALLSGFTTGGETYALGAGSGQTLRLSLTTKDPKARASVATPGKTKILEVSPGTSAQVRLPEKGTYLVEVTSSSAPDAPDLDYDLDLEIP